MTMLTTIRTAVFSIAIAGVALGAMPAQAAPLGALKLELQAPAAPKGGEMQMKKFGGDDYDDEDDFSWCLTNKQIRKGLKNADFDEIDFVKNLSKHRVRVAALYEGDEWYYSMRINRCTGEVDGIKKLYPADEEPDFDIDF